MRGFRETVSLKTGEYMEASLPTKLILTPVMIPFWGVAAALNLRDVVGGSNGLDSAPAEAPEKGTGSEGE